MVGGATYEESLAIHQLNCAFPNARIVLGGSTLHNSASFLKEVESAILETPQTSTRSHILRNIKRS